MELDYSSSFQVRRCSKEEGGMKLPCLRQGPEKRTLACGPQVFALSGHAALQPPLGNKLIVRCSLTQGRESIYAQPLFQF